MLTAAVQRALVLRHGTSTWNAEGRWQGWLDAPLTAEGEAQAAARARELAHAGDPAPRHLHLRPRAGRAAPPRSSRPTSSARPPRRRASANATAASGRAGPRAEIEAGWPGMREAWRRGELTAPPGGEDDAQLLTRVDAATRARDRARRPEHARRRHAPRRLRTLLVRRRARSEPLIPNLGGYWFDERDRRLVDPEPIGDLVAEPEEPTVE